MLFRIYFIIIDIYGTRFNLNTYIYILCFVFLILVKRSNNHEVILLNIKIRIITFFIIIKNKAIL